ncbi:hypothetical protein K1719_034671 [Acacia pycnantha]|nr:hypothetical protein K1719_034671 [Acacia pycnantha]
MRLLNVADLGLDTFSDGADSDRHALHSGGLYACLFYGIQGLKGKNTLDLYIITLKDHDGIFLSFYTSFSCVYPKVFLLDTGNLVVVEGRLNVYFGDYTGVSA